MSVRLALDGEHIREIPQQVGLQILASPRKAPSSRARASARSRACRMRSSARGDGGFSTTMRAPKRFTAFARGGRGRRSTARGS